MTETFSNGWRAEAVCARDIAAVFAVVKKSFDAFVAPGYSPEGIAEFYRFANPEAMVSRLPQNIMLAAKNARGEMGGFIELRNECHISLLFTDPVFARQGIARLLFESAKALCPETKEFEVNSSFFAVPVYEKLGFAAVGPERTVNGITFVPMKTGTDVTDI